MSHNLQILHQLFLGKLRQVLTLTMEVSGLTLYFLVSHVLSGLTCTFWAENNPFHVQDSLEF